MYYLYHLYLCTTYTIYTCISTIPRNYPYLYISISPIPLLYLYINYIYIPSIPPYHLHLYIIYTSYIYTINACIPYIPLYYRYLCSRIASVGLSSFITFTSVPPLPITFLYVFIPIWLTFCIFSLSFAEKGLGTVSFSLNPLLFPRILLHPKCIYIFSPFLDIRGLLTVSPSVIQTFIDEVRLKSRS
jgi:hypothetical protein